MTVRTSDAVVIGAGQAGQAAPAVAARCRKEGVETAVIERHHFGATCVNVGCVPTEALVVAGIRTRKRGCIVVDDPSRSGADGVPTPVLVFGDAPTRPPAEPSIGPCRDDGTVATTAAATRTDPPTTPSRGPTMSNALNDELQVRLTGPDGALAKVEPALREAGNATAHALEELRHTARDLARGGVHAIQSSAGQARDSGARYIHAHPAKAMLIAAGAGAVLVLLAALTMRAGDRSR